MTEEIHCTPGQLNGLIAKRLERIRKNAEKAIASTAKASVKIVQNRTPKAFGELKESVHSEPDKVVIDAPHAAAVEVGSAPHTPNFEKLLAWVKLRGMQGLSRPGSLKRMGHTTLTQATKIQAMLAAETKRGPGGMFSPVDSAVSVARAISKGIEKEGTKPHFFVRSSLPEIGETLLKKLEAAIKK